MADDKTSFSRRTLLFAGGAMAAGITASSLVWGRHPEADEPEESQPLVGAFDMRTGSMRLEPSPLFYATGPQSFAFDDANGLIYALQTVAGDIQLPDENKPVSSTDRKRSGDMCLIQLSNSGEFLGHMILRGFGHGISFGVEPVDGRTNIWVEGKSEGKSGYGRSVARVRFKDGSVLDSSDSGVRHFDPLPGASHVTPALDLPGERMLVSHEEDGEQRFVVYGKADFLAERTGHAQPLEDGVQVKGEEFFQGCVLHGDFVYVLTGGPYTGKEGNNPPGSGGNTYITAIDVRTGQTQARHHVTVAPDLPHREPEGIAVSSAGPAPALCIGFSVKAKDHRQLTVYSFTA
ncbi:signaling protein [Streptomyces sp. 4.24]|uniref:phage baseplate protein n=1 Tax=Streptomyces tritrimontium TaxID=3406573 RepID=UPI003BB60822